MMDNQRSNAGQNGETAETWPSRLESPVRENPEGLTASGFWYAELQKRHMFPA
jgi:hypothetical protein